MKIMGTLIRTVVISAPDGTSTSRTESITAEIDWPDELKGQLPYQDGYSVSGDWRLIKWA